MDTFVLGAVPPYSFLLGGKLVAMLAASNEVRAAFGRKYSGAKSVISGEEFDGRLAMLTTMKAWCPGGAGIMAKHRVNIDLRLIHDGQRWVANNERIAVSGRTLAELGESVKKAVAATGNHPPGTKVTVRMRFDYDTIPNAAWYRQFMPYYFDHLVSFEIGT